MVAVVGLVAGAAATARMGVSVEFYYLCPKHIWEQHLDCFAESHHIDTPTPGIILLCAKFHHKLEEAHWRSVPEVEALPHALSPQVISVRHSGLLERLGVQLKHTTMDVAEQSAKFSEGMRFSGI